VVLVSFVTFLLLFVAVALCANGVDISDAVSTSGFQCLKQQGYSFAIVRCFRSTGSVDPNCASNVANAHSAGMSNVDIYVFPCPKCSSSGSAQIATTLAYTQQNGVKFSTMWLDIEGSQYWGSQSSNQAFFADMVSAAKSHGVNVAVYTSASQWQPIMGSYTGGSSLPLWYAHYDNSQSFGDFSPFNGWSKPAMKQYNGDKTLCNIGVDFNWYPGGSTATSTTQNTTSGPASSGPNSSGPNSSGPNSSSGPSGPSSTGGPSGPSSTGKTSGPSSSGQTTGPSSSGNTTGGTNSGPSSGNGTTSGYTSGSSGSSGSSSEFRLSSDSIYATKGGGKKMTIVEDSAAEFEQAQEAQKQKEEAQAKLAQRNKEKPLGQYSQIGKAAKSGGARKAVEVPEIEHDTPAEAVHFQVWEEKAARKFE